MKPSSSDAAHAMTRSIDSFPCVNLAIILVMGSLRVPHVDLEHERRTGERAGIGAGDIHVTSEGAGPQDGFSEYFPLSQGANNLRKPAKFTEQQARQLAAAKVVVPLTRERTAGRRGQGGGVGTGAGRHGGGNGYQLGARFCRGGSGRDRQAHGGNRWRHHGQHSSAYGFSSRSRALRRDEQDFQDLFPQWRTSPNHRRRGRTAWQFEAGD